MRHPALNKPLRRWSPATESGEKRVFSQATK